MNSWKLHFESEKLMGHNKGYDLTPKVAFKKLVDSHTKVQAKEKERLQSIISKSPYYSVAYALFLGKPFPEGEDAIAQDAMHSYEYSLTVLNGKRFKKGEESISKNPVTAYHYAIDIMKGAFPMGEKAISKSNYADLYKNFTHL